MPADVQMNVGGSDAHVHGLSTGRSEQIIMMSFCDVMRISHAIEGGNYKRRAPPTLGAVVWVFSYKAFGSVDESHTLYSSCLSASHGEEHIQNRLCDLFVHMHVPRPFWGIFS